MFYFRLHVKACAPHYPKSPFVNFAQPNSLAAHGADWPKCKNFSPWVAVAAVVDSFKLIHVYIDYISGHASLLACF
jgi:hypothetical protein